MTVGGVGVNLEVGYWQKRKDVLSQASAAWQGGIPRQFSGQALKYGVLQPDIPYFLTDFLTQP